MEWDRPYPWEGLSSTESGKKTFLDDHQLEWKRDYPTVVSLTQIELETVVD
jgi:hypothetical protein